MRDNNELLSNMILELRRGTLVLSVISQLGEAKYGYHLVQILEEKGIQIDPNTLYPLLRRLEKQGILCSEWQTGEANPRKYYKRTEQGTKIYSELKKHWKEISVTMEKMLVEDENDE